MRQTRRIRNITLKRLTTDFYQSFRAQKFLVRILGPQFSRSRTLLEIDLTYRCNLRCNNCNRSCTQAPSETDISYETVAAFIEESIERGQKWERIRLLGGEPTLHPKLEALLEMLLAYKADHLPHLRIVLCTNGSGHRVNRILSRLPREVMINNTYKGWRQKLLRPFNMAPADSIFFRMADYGAGCRIIKECGLGLTPSGYYPCAVAGGIDRVFGFGMGRSCLPLPGDEMRDQMAVFCRYCGHFGFRWPVRKQKMSPVWKTAYASHKRTRVHHQPGSQERTEPIDQ